MGAPRDAVLLVLIEVDEDVALDVDRVVRVGAELLGLFERLGI